MEAVFRIQFRHVPGETFLAKDDGQIVGVMRIIEWPDCQMSIMQNLRLLPAMIRALKGTFVRAARFSSVWAKHDPKEHHWHLDPIGVLPARQGEGIGSMLLEYFCKRVDMVGAAAYLETGKPENVRLYERFGFSVTGTAPVLGVPTWLMWRPAARREPECVFSKRKEHTE